MSGTVSKPKRVLVSGTLTSYSAPGTVYLASRGSLSGLLFGNPTELLNADCQFDDQKAVLEQTEINGSISKFAIRHHLTKEYLGGIWVDANTGGVALHALPRRFTTETYQEVKSTPTTAAVDSSGDSVMSPAAAPSSAASPSAPRASTPRPKRPPRLEVPGEPTEPASPPGGSTPGDEKGGDVPHDRSHDHYNHIGCLSVDKLENTSHHLVRVHILFRTGRLDALHWPGFELVAWSHRHGLWTLRWLPSAWFKVGKAPWGVAMPHSAPTETLRASAKRVNWNERTVPDYDTGLLLYEPHYHEGCRPSDRHNWRSTECALFIQYLGHELWINDKDRAVAKFPIKSYCVEF